MSPTTADAAAAAAAAASTVTQPAPEPLITDELKRYGPIPEPIASVIPTKFVVHGKYPVPHVKRIHFVRHAQGYHNAAAAKYGYSAYRLDDYRDARLTDLGIRQALSLRAHTSSLPIERIITSTLSRTLETAYYAFGPHHHRLIRVVEHCREHIENPCDRRRAISHIRADFPFADYSAVADEHDPFEGESHEELQRRAAAFINYLADLPESHVAVVSHSTFLDMLMSQIAKRAGLKRAPHGLYSYQNAELKTVEIEFRPHPFMPKSDA